MTVLERYRGLRGAFAVLALAPNLVLGCRSAVRPVPSSELVTLTGHLSIVIGDPAPPGGQPQVLTYLTTEDGRTVSLRADSAHAAWLSAAGRFRQTRVRATGRFDGADSTTLWIERLDSVPAGVR